ncbi:MAG: ROK family protein [Alphaproteobacteria bacterium]
MRIGIDVGGTKIEGIALGRTGETLIRERVSTPREHYSRTIGAIADLVDRIEREAGQQGTIGIGIPGTISRKSGLVKNANSTCLIGQPFDRDIARRLGRPVRIANDADCFAMSEARDGAAAGAHTVFGVILGTGVGGGLIVGGALLDGPNGIVGEWGHNPMPDENDALAPPCYCGRSGCIETYLSGPGLAHDHFGQTGERLPAQEIAEAGRNGNLAAIASLDRYAERLGRALAGVINITDPEVIVLGGGLSNIPGLITKIAEPLARHVFSDSVETKILTPMHGDSSGVRGAAFLWPDDC